MTMTTGKKNLVIVPAGDASLHSGWLLSEPERNWDLVVCYYGDDPHMFRGDGLARIDLKGPKYQILHEILASGDVDWRRYERIMLPDDDLEMDGRAINRFFDICAEHRLDLAQPALDALSFISFPITRENPRYLLRWTNYVEVMAPCFTRDALEACLGSFLESRSGWGLDFLWPSRIGGSMNIAIIDEIAVRHTRPVGGPSYGLLKKMGIDARDDATACLSILGQESYSKRIIAGLTKNGRIKSFESRLPGFIRILQLLLEGEPVAAYLERERMRGVGPRGFQTVLVDQIFGLLGYPAKWFRTPSGSPRS